MPLKSPSTMAKPVGPAIVVRGPRTISPASFMSIDTEINLISLASLIPTMSVKPDPLNAAVVTSLQPLGPVLASRLGEKVRAVTPKLVTLKLKNTLTNWVNGPVLANSTRLGPVPVPKSLDIKVP